MAKVFPTWDLVTLFNLLTKVTVSVTRSAKHIERKNEYVRSLVEECPDRIIQCYRVSLSNPGFMDLFEARFQAWGFGVIKLHQCWESFTIDSDEFEGVAAWATDKDLPNGRDNLKLNLQRVRALHLSGEDEGMILGGNMKRLLKLQV
jgi:hypothetical protein